MPGAPGSCCWPASPPDTEGGSHVGHVLTKAPTRQLGRAARWRRHVLAETMSAAARSPRTGRSMDATALEHVVDRTADAVPRARKLAADAISTSDASLAEDVELVVTELVTNALLHGTPPVVLRISPADARVRIEVEDSGAEMRMRMRENVEAMTGRGLSLVSRLSSGWGVEPLGDRGKVVWAEIAEGELAPDDVGGGGDVDALLAAWSDDDPLEETYSVALGAVPTDLLLEAKAHIDNLVREFTLASAAAGGG